MPISEPPIVAVPPLSSPPSVTFTAPDASRSTSAADCRP
jgi:hypothetical protein